MALVIRKGVSHYAQKTFEIIKFALVHNILLHICPDETDVIA